MDENGRPSDAALLAAMKQDMDSQISRLNDNRIYLIATCQELSEQNAELKSRLASALAKDVEPQIVEHEPSAV